MARHSILIARFPYLNQECPDVGDWLARTIPILKADPHIGEIRHVRLDDTPITMTRNAAVEAAKQEKCDYILMLDSDMKPDLAIPGHKPFFASSWEWLMQHRDTPSIVAAPYVGPPPFENVYVFRWGNRSNNPLVPDFTLDQYTRAEAQWRIGFEEVAALPTGLIIIDVRVFDMLKTPYFYYEYTDKTESRKASTEDVTFTRDASLAGAKLYCNWDAWAGHHKRYMCGKPVPMTADAVRKTLAEAVLLGMNSGDRIMEVGVGEPRRTAPKMDRAELQRQVEAMAAMNAGRKGGQEAVQAGVQMHGGGLAPHYGGGGGTKSEA